MIYIALYFSPTHGDGTSQVVKNILNNLSSGEKSNITVLCNDASQPDEFFFDSVKCVNFKTKEFPLLDAPLLFARLVYSYKLYGYLKNVIKDEDVINIHEGAGVSFFPSFFKGRIKQRYKLIITLHGSIFRTYTNYAKLLPRRYFITKSALYIFKWYAWLIEKKISKQADYFIFVTNKTRTFFQKEYGFGNNYFIIPNGLSEKINSFHGQDKKENNDIMEVVIVGSGVLIKGLNIAIEAVKKVNEERKRIRLNVIGFRDFHHYFPIGYQSDYINYIGPVSPSEMSSWYDKMDFLIQPSLSEESPSLVILEALEKNLPFIASLACANSELSELEKYGYVVNSFESEEWKKAIEKMLNHHAYNIFLKNIKEADFSEFIWSNIAKKYEEVFKLMQLDPH
jgi:glycosyltransferase involved in cell wall biosynthesis